jgi:hypothetical protein
MRNFYLIISICSLFGNLALAAFDTVTLNTGTFDLPSGTKLIALTPFYYATNGHATGEGAYIKNGLWQTVDVDYLGLPLKAGNSITTTAGGTSGGSCGSNCLVNLGSDATLGTIPPWTVVSGDISCTVGGFFTATFRTTWSDKGTVQNYETASTVTTGLACTPSGSATNVSGSSFSFRTSPGNRICAKQVLEDNSSLPSEISTQGGQFYYADCNAACTCTVGHT